MLTVDGAVFDSYGGTYVLGPDRSIELVRDATALVAITRSGQRHELLARSERSFYSPSANLTFQFEVSESHPDVVSLVLTGPDGAVLANATRVGARGDSHLDPTQFVGTYVSDEISAL